MKRIRLFLPLAAASLCGFLMAAEGAAVKRMTVLPDAANHSEDSEIPESRAKVVSYGDKEVVKVNTKLRYTTLIILPKSEQILDFTCGDKEFWIINGNQNFAYVKPAKAGAQTNVNLVTASGNVYSFVLV